VCFAQPMKTCKQQIQTYTAHIKTFKTQNKPFFVTIQVSKLR
jgi:hypothetical protein